MKDLMNWWMDLIDWLIRIRCVTCFSSMSSSSWFSSRRYYSLSWPYQTKETDNTCGCHSGLSMPTFCVAMNSYDMIIRWSLVQPCSSDPLSPFQSFPVDRRFFDPSDWCLFIEMHVRCSLLTPQEAILINIKPLSHTDERCDIISGSINPPSQTSQLNKAWCTSDKLVTTADRRYGWYLTVVLTASSQVVHHTDLKYFPNTQHQTLGRCREFEFSSFSYHKSFHVLFGRRPLIIDARDNWAINEPVHPLIRLHSHNSATVGEPSKDMSEELSTTCRQDDANLANSRLNLSRQSTGSSPTRNRELNTYMVQRIEFAK